MTFDMCHKHLNGQKQNEPKITLILKLKRERMEKEKKQASNCDPSDLNLNSQSVEKCYSGEAFVAKTLNLS